ncbi:hypothetical protein ATANTOWER_020487 [Ataeniobius toweri]|uniref:BAAT/Acyl-CoA thioester hydrolase C-terminal domain-containing protein n=1 Tax=Ataeniobius toweri TaxID=208326 RepID=A0ABU7BTN1_9TELE|nr:hypothetical protein [Ataeniobius toweri]
MAKKFSKIRLDENKYEIWRDTGLALMEDAPCKVDMAQVIEASGKTHLLYRLEYPNTGHLIEPPFSPHFRATNLTLHGTKDKGAKVFHRFIYGSCQVIRIFILLNVHHCFIFIILVDGNRCSSRMSRYVCTFVLLLIIRRAGC